MGNSARKPKPTLRKENKKKEGMTRDRHDYYIILAYISASHFTDSIGNCASSSWKKKKWTVITLKSDITSIHAVNFPIFPHNQLITFCLSRAQPHLKKRKEEKEVGDKS